MSSENFEKNHKNDEKVIKKSTFNILISSIIITVGVASFFAGSYVSILIQNKFHKKNLKMKLQNWN